MDAYIASVPMHIFVAVQMIKQNHIDNCDLYYVPTSKNVNELIEKIKEQGIFKNVYLLPNINIEYPITLGQIIEISLNRFKVRKMLKNKEYDTVYYNTDGWLLNSIMFSSFKNKKSKNVFVENGINPYITPYDSKEWYLRLFINCSLMTCMDGRYVDERFVFEPGLISVQQSGVINQINKVDCQDSRTKQVINSIFNFDEKLDSFNGKDIIIMEQGPRKEPIDMLALWNRVSTYIEKERSIVKSHPRQKDSVLRQLHFEVYERYVIPWEVISFNTDMSDKTLITIFSTSCVNPKLMFDQEPRVIMMYKLLGMDYSFFGEGLIQFVSGVGELYKDKTKFFVPETWEEFAAYCHQYLK